MALFFACCDLSDGVPFWGAERDPPCFLKHCRPRLVGSNVGLRSSGSASASFCLEPPRSEYRPAAAGESVLGRRSYGRLSFHAGDVFSLVVPSASSPAAVSGDVRG